MSQDDAFLQTLASCSDACADLDLSDDGWKPPVGSYDVEFTSLQTGEGKKVTGVFVKPIFTVLEGEFEGKTFTDYYFIVPNADPNDFKQIAPLKRMAQLATCIAGREVRDAVEVMGILNAASGQEFLTMEIYETTGKKGPNKGKVFKNIRWLSLIESAEDVAEEAESEVAEEATA